VRHAVFANFKVKKGLKVGAVSKLKKFLNGRPFRNLVLFCTAMGGSRTAGSLNGC
jgi:hypothetical protein